MLLVDAILVGRCLRCGWFDCLPKSGSDVRLEQVALVLKTSKHGDWMQGTVPLLEWLKLSHVSLQCF